MGSVVGVKNRCVTGVTDDLTGCLTIRNIQSAIDFERTAGGGHLIAIEAESNLLTGHDGQRLAGDNSLTCQVIVTARQTIRFRCGIVLQNTLRERCPVFDHTAACAAVIAYAIATAAADAVVSMGRLFCHNGHGGDTNHQHQNQQQR